MLCLCVCLLLIGRLAAAKTFTATFYFPGNQPDIAMMDTEYNPVYRPSTGALVTVGIPYDIKWDRTNNETINFKLFTAQSGTEFAYTGFEFQLLDGNLNYYEWNLNPEIASGQDYVLRLNRDAISPTFAITNSAFSSPTSSTAVSSTSSTAVSSTSSTTSSAIVATTLPNANSQSSKFVTLSTTTSENESIDPNTSSMTTANGLTSGSSTTAVSSTASEGSVTSSSGTTGGLVHTGTSTPSSNGGGGGLSSEAKIGLGVGVAFGAITTVGVILAYLQYRKTHPRSQYIISSNKFSINVEKITCF